MANDSIEREIFIAAPPERVWPFVAEPGFWATDDENLRGTRATPGEAFVARHSQHGAFPMRVDRAEPPRYLACRWNSAFPGEELTDANSTLVEFTLTAENGGTRLRVVETGFAALPTTEANRLNVIKDHASGWEQCLHAVAARTL